MVRFTGAELVFVAGCDPLRCLAHRAFWACAILRREAADTIRVARVPFRDTPGTVERLDYGNCFVPASQLPPALGYALGEAAAGHSVDFPFFPL